MKTTSFLISLALFLLNPRPVYSAPLDFDALWGQIRKNSPSQKGVEHELNAEEIASSRASRHWLPRLYLDGRSYVTDDPGQVLFSKLGERSVTGQDFSPFNMNNPDAETHSHVSLGASLMLFEGGAKQSISDFRSLNVRSLKLKKSATESNERGMAAAAYAQLLIASEINQALGDLKNLVAGILSRYQIGRQDNPVGYSGLLGLKTLQHRIGGEKLNNEAKLSSIRSALSEMAGIAPTWEVKPQSVEEFCKTHLDGGQGGTDGFAVEAQVAASEAMQKLSKAEYARFLPQVGLFAEQYYNRGPTTNASSYSGGVFVRWELDGTNIGAVKEAQEKAFAVEAQAAGLRLQQNTTRKRLEVALPANVETLRLAEESAKLLSEQTDIARRLFQSGSINALQLAEVLNRRVDLVLARGQMQEAYVKMKSEEAVLNNKL